jgi:replicative DNA helicase
LANNLYSPNMEESALSCVFKNPEYFSVLNDVCSTDDFWYPPYKNIWSSFVRLNEKNSKIDLITVQDDLERNGIFEGIVSFDEANSGKECLIFLKNKENVNVDNSETYGRKIRDDSSKRKIKEATDKCIGWINQGNDATEILTNLDIELGKISSYAGANLNASEPIFDVVTRAMEETELASKNNKKYIETGINALDEKIGGLFDGELITIAARSGAGKSSLAMTIALNVSMRNQWRKKVGIFTLEMNNVKYVNRMISALTGIPFLRIKTGNIYPEEKDSYIQVANAIQQSNHIILDDTTRLSMPLIRNKIRKMKEWGTDLIIVDQLSLIKDDKINEQEFARVDRISYELKGFATEFDIPIILIQQLNRSIESSTRGADKEPRLSDLNQAGENAPSIVLMITHEKEAGIVKASKIWVVKNRDGATGYADVKFEYQKTYFRDLTEEERLEMTPDMMKD